MICKLAWRNVRRSARDYAIYFATLLFGVAVFYAFNSIGSQQVLFDLKSTATAAQFRTTADLLNMFSVVIAGVLGFLVLYANRFLVRRRKQEFGIYLLLGMKPVSVSAIVLVETVMVGLFALVVGIVAGVVLSQGLSFVTASLFDMVLANYQFVFSQSAFAGTIACFAVIFIVVAMFNTFSVSRFSLVNLLQADLRNEKMSVRNPWLCGAVFVVALGILTFAYVRLQENGLVMLDDPAFLQATVGMLLGSLLFFWSLAGLVINLVSRCQPFYLKKLRPFTLRQVASRVNTAFLSLWVICVLLFFSITCFSCGMGLADVFTRQVDGGNPYSATLRAAVWTSDSGASATDNPLTRRAEMEAEAPERLAQAEAAQWSMAQVLQAGAGDLWDSTVGGWAQIDYMTSPDCSYAAMVDVLKQSGKATEEDLEMVSGVEDSGMLMVSISQLNDALALQGKPPVVLEPGQYVVNNNMDSIQKLVDIYVDEAPVLTLGGQELACASEPIAVQMEDNTMLSSGFVLVVPDEVIQAAFDANVIPTTCYLNIDYADNGRTDEENRLALEQIIAAVQPASEEEFSRGDDSSWAGRLWPVTSMTTREGMIAQSQGLRMMITYLALYIGFVFLVSTAAILAIQQLSNVADSTGRYRTLYRLGCDNRQVFGSLFVQILIYFATPLLLALCHCACAISAMEETLFRLANVPMTGPIAMAAAFLLVIYGGYFVITYFTSRNMVKGVLRQP